jgi:glycosyltransferase involved in cell wall biosynthesis
VDRFSGFENQVKQFLAGQEYEIAVIEHFWCASYVDILREHCIKVALNLHNIESALLQRCSTAEHWSTSLLFRRFAERCRSLEREWLPRFDVLLTTSALDRDAISEIAPAPEIIVYPNALPWMEVPARNKCEEIVFSGNLEYHPNVSAVSFFYSQIWPGLKQRHPGLIWRLIGKNEERFRRQFAGVEGIEVTGPIENAVWELARSRVAVVPLISGSGTRIKILEAWAAGLPVVSTSLGAEGLGAVSGTHLLIADTPQQFQDHILAVLASKGLQNQIGRNGRELFETRFTWDAAWDSLSKGGFVNP